MTVGLTRNGTYPKLFVLKFAGLTLQDLPNMWDLPDRDLPNSEYIPKLKYLIFCKLLPWQNWKYIPKLKYWKIFQIETNQMFSENFTVGMTQSGLNQNWNTKKPRNLSAVIVINVWD